MIILIRKERITNLTTDARLLQYGGLFKVAPDSRVVTDGVDISGSSDVNELMITGESRPLDQSPGFTVVAGSLSGARVLVVRLTHPPSENTVSEVAAIVNQVKFSEAKVQEIVNLVAG